MTITPYPRARPRKRLAADKVVSCAQSTSSPGRTWACWGPRSSSDRSSPRLCRNAYTSPEAPSERLEPYAQARLGSSRRGSVQGCFA